MKTISTMLFLGLFAICHAQHAVRYRQCTQGCTTTNDGLNTPFAYGGPTDFITEDIVSDYGTRRNCGTCSIWHKGTDLSSLQNGGGDTDRGDAIVVIEGSTIKRVVGDVAYKYITVSGTAILGLKKE